MFESEESNPGADGFLRCCAFCACCVLEEVTADDEDVDGCNVVGPGGGVDVGAVDVDVDMGTFLRFSRFRYRTMVA